MKPSGGTGEGRSQSVASLYVERFKIGEIGEGGAGRQNERGKSDPSTSVGMTKIVGWDGEERYRRGKGTAKKFRAQPPLS